MREESHLEDMRSAIRGDLERLAERRGEQELMRTPACEDDPALPESQTTPHGHGEPRRSWFTRFVSP